MGFARFKPPSPLIHMVSLETTAAGIREMEGVNLLQRGGSRPGAKGEIEMKEKPDDAPCGRAKCRVVEGDAKEGAYCGAKEKVAAQAHETEPGPRFSHALTPKHCSLARRASQRRSTSAWIWAMSSLPRSPRKRWRNRPWVLSHSSTGTRSLGL